MTKELQLTTHNAERRAHSTCRERSETRSSPKRTEKNICCSLIDKISWRFRIECSAVFRKRVVRYVGDLEETCLVIWRTRIRRFSVKRCRCFGETVWRFLRKSFGDFGENRSAILEKIVRRFWRKPFGDFGENRLVLALEIWRNLFGEIVVSDLEKSFGDFGENCSVISYWRSLWSIAMLGDRTWRLKHNGEKE